MIIKINSKILILSFKQQINNKYYKYLYDDKFYYICKVYKDNLKIINSNTYKKYWFDQQ